MAYQLIRSYEATCNGRLAWMALCTFYKSAGVLSTHKIEARDIIMLLKYDGELRHHTFTDYYVSKHIGAAATLKKLGEPIAEYYSTSNSSSRTSLVMISRFKLNLLPQWLVSGIWTRSTTIFPPWSPWNVLMPTRRRVKSRSDNNVGRKSYGMVNARMTRNQERHARLSMILSLKERMTVSHLAESPSR